MVGSCQDPMSDAGRGAPVLAIAGVAGSGKTTLGRRLADVLNSPLLDLDSLTNPLLEKLAPLLGDRHWNDPGPHRDLIRVGRYAVLRSAAADMVSVGLRPVLVAPFTRELTGGDEWQELLDSAAPAPITVIHIDGPPELFERRRGRRGESRDRHRGDDDAVPTARPVVPCVGVDAEATTDDQVAHVLAELGIRRP